MVRSASCAGAVHEPVMFGAAFDQPTFSDVGEELV